MEAYSGGGVTMTRDEFNKIVAETLLSMGDVDVDVSDKSWDGEYNKMKSLTPSQFKKLCRVGANHYVKADTSHLN